MNDIQVNFCLTCLKLFVLFSGPIVFLFFTFVFYLYHASIFDKIFSLYRMDLIIHKICYKCFILAGISEETDGKNADKNTDKNTAGLNEDVQGK